MSAVATRPPRAGALTGTQKAAILCLALGAEASARILQQLGPEDVEQLSREIARTGMVPGETVDAVLHEYRDVLRTVEQNAEGGAEYARQMLETALGGARARSVFDRITKEPEELGLSRFRRASPDVLHSVLRGEHPQTVALVLAHIAPKLASGVLEAMGRELLEEPADQPVLGRSVADEVGERRSQRGGDPPQQHDRHVSFAGLELGEVALGHTRLDRQRLARQPAPLASLAHSFAERGQERCTVVARVARFDGRDRSGHHRACPGVIRFP